MTIRDSFIFYRSFYSSIEQLPKMEQLKAYKAIIKFALDGEETEMNGTSSIIYEMAKPVLNANNKKYTNGLKGGRPRDDESPRKELPDIDFVNITVTQYKRACEKFGENIVLRAISILDSWLAKNGKTQQQYLGKNHYGFFKSDSWNIKEAQKALQEQQSISTGEYNANASL